MIRNGSGLRLATIDSLGLLDYAYSELIEGADAEHKLRIDATLLGRIGENGGFIIDDPELPAALQGKEAPSWWNPYEKAFEMTTLTDVELA